MLARCWPCRMEAHIVFTVWNARLDAWEHRARKMCVSANRLHGRACKMLWRTCFLKSQNCKGVQPKTMIECFHASEFLDSCIYFIAYSLDCQLAYQFDVSDQRVISQHVPNDILIRGSEKNTLKMLYLEREHAGLQKYFAIWFIVHWSMGITRCGLRTSILFHRISLRNLSHLVYNP